MTAVSVIVAALVAWVWGIVWYMIMARQWAEAAGMTGKEDSVDRKIAAVISLVCLILVAGMMRHMMFEAGITAPGKGFLAGAGVGLFIVTAFLVLSYTWQARPAKLMVIDGIHVTVGTALIGLMLTVV